MRSVHREVCSRSNLQGWYRIQSTTSDDVVGAALRFVEWPVCVVRDQVLDPVLVEMHDE